MVESKVILWAVLLSGLGTFLLRWIPLRQNGIPSSPKAGGFTRFTQAVGPAAIISLLLAMLFPLLHNKPEFSHWLAILMGFATTYEVQNRKPGIALPTLSGALVYGMTAMVLMT